MKHPHIVEFKGAFLTPRYLALIMEYVEGETLDVSLCMAVHAETGGLACMAHGDGYGCLLNHFINLWLAFKPALMHLQSFLEKCGGRMVEALARFVFQQLILAVEFCHRKGKVLRDIKLGNTLLAICNGQLPLLKLCDFSISRDVVRDPNFYSQVRHAFPSGALS